MSRPSSTAIRAELDLIESLIARYPEGVSRTALQIIFAEASGSAIRSRTLLRRLERLVAEGRVRQEGRGPATLYRPGPALVLEAPALEEGYVPLSRGGAQVRALVRLPVFERNPVGYDVEFLRRYAPGRTWYLSRVQREALHELGQTPEGHRPAGTYAHDILGRLLIDLSWASSRLEGNTYTRLDTQNLIEYGQLAEGKDLSEAQMILNHKAAIELLVEGADRLGFNLFTFRSIHAALSENLLGDAMEEGCIRTRVVDISGTVYQPLGIPQQIEDNFRLLLEKCAAIPDPFEQAFFVMVQLPYLQPFIDVNKRTARLGANLSLIKANLVPLSFVDVPEQAYIDGTLGIYELNRVELLRDVFIWGYERSASRYKVIRDSLGEPDPIRLKYRAELATVVREVVRQGSPPRLELLREWAVSHGVRQPEIEHFSEVALTLLLALHEGVLYRYKIDPGEFRAWEERFAGSE